MGREQAGEQMGMEVRSYKTREAKPGLLGVVWRGFRGFSPSPGAANQG
jgi:hypothetical protein